MDNNTIIVIVAAIAAAFWFGFKKHSPTASAVFVGLAVVLILNDTTWGAEAGSELSTCVGNIAN